MIFQEVPTDLVGFLIPSRGALSAVGLGSRRLHSKLSSRWLGATSLWLLLVAASTPVQKQHGFQGTDGHWTAEGSTHLMCLGGHKDTHSFRANHTEVSIALFFPSQKHKSGSHTPSIHFFFLSLSLSFEVPDHILNVKKKITIWQ